MSTPLPNETVTSDLTLGEAVELLEEWQLASDNFDLANWATRVRDALERSPFPKSIHVHPAWWCACCASCVPRDHVCACETLTALREVK